MLSAFIREMRPKQYTKNLLIFAALLFSGNLFVIDKLRASTVTFGAFCLVASSVYIINDIFDKEKDRIHPIKCYRPIASGEISVPVACVFSVIIFLVGLLLTYRIDFYAVILLLSYAVVNFFYTFWLKHVVIIDTMIIAYGFVVRAVIGAVVIHSGMTVWFLLCVMFLSLFLALGKRRGEMVLLGKDTVSTGRKVLKQYTIGLLDQLMTVAASVLILCYSLFTVAPQTRDAEKMVLTIPVVVYGIFYYLWFVHKKAGGAAPDEALYKERPLLAAVVIYFVLVAVIRNL